MATIAREIVCSIGMCLGRDDTETIRDSFFAKIGYRGKNCKRESNLDLHYYYSY